MEKLLCQVCGSEEMLYENGIFRCKYCHTSHIKRTDTEQSLLSTAERELDILHFENAEDMFRDFIEKYPAVSAGYWGLVRAKFSIKYVTDANGKRLPICHASKYEDFSKDPDFQKAIRYAENREIKDRYYEESVKIKETCEEWRETAKKYSYDVFISFKATENGERTDDYTEMQNLYTHLTEKGYKVFFAPVSAREFTGKKYDAYILNALDTAKAMILYGSKEEYFTATWVQTEWMRYLRMQSKGEKQDGSLLIVYNNLAAHSLPWELRSIQALDGNSKNLYTQIEEHLEKLLTSQRRQTEKYCLACGAKNDLETKYCRECGGNKFVDTYEEYRARLLSQVERQNQKEKKEEKRKALAEARAEKKAAWAAGKAARKEKAKILLKRCIPFAVCVAAIALLTVFFSVCYAIKPALKWLKWTDFLSGTWLKVGLKTRQWQLILTGATVLIVLGIGFYILKKKLSPVLYYVLCALSVGLFAVLPSWWVLIIGVAEVAPCMFLSGFGVKYGIRDRGEKSDFVKSIVWIGIILTFWMILFAVKPELFIGNLVKLKAMANGDGEHAVAARKLFNGYKGRAIALAVFAILCVIGCIVASCFVGSVATVFYLIVPFAIMFLVSEWYMAAFIGDIIKGKNTGDAFGTGLIGGIGLLFSGFGLFFAVWGPCQETDADSNF